MSWQDIVLSVGSFIFVISLFPSVLSKDKPAITTSIINGVVLAIYVFTYFSMGLSITALSCFILAVLWFILAFQKHKIISRTNTKLE